MATRTSISAASSSSIASASNNNNDGRRIQPWQSRIDADEGQAAAGSSEEETDDVETGMLYFPDSIFPSSYVPFSSENSLQCGPPCSLFASQPRTSDVQQLHDSNSPMQLMYRQSQGNGRVARKVALQMVSDGVMDNPRSLLQQLSPSGPPLGTWLRAFENGRADM